MHTGKLCPPRDFGGVRLSTLSQSKTRLANHRAGLDAGDLGE